MLRAIGHALLFILLAIPLGFVGLYLWRRHANSSKDGTPVASKPQISGASIGGPAAAAKTRAEVSSGGPMVGAESAYHPMPIFTPDAAPHVDSSEAIDLAAHEAEIAARNAAALAQVVAWKARDTADASAITKGSNDSTWLAYYNFAVETGAMKPTDAAASTLADLKTSVAGKTTPEGIRFDSAGNSLGMGAR